MSEFTPISVPAARDNTAGTVNGFRELLELNLGRRVTAEFLVGLDETAVKTGTLYAVQPDYFVLNDDYGNYVAADLFSLKFVTFCPDCVAADAAGQAQDTLRSGQETAPQTGADAEGTEKGMETQPAETVQTPAANRTGTIASMAALNYAKRKARRLD